VEKKGNFRRKRKNGTFAIAGVNDATSHPAVVLNLDACGLKAVDTHFGAFSLAGFSYSLIRQNFEFSFLPQLRHTITLMLTSWSFETTES
jgi:hypothetical protein